jgi:hypothetical protein
MSRSVKDLAAYKTSRRAGAIDSRVLLSSAFLAAALCVLALAVLQYLSKQQRTHLTRRMEELQEGTADTQTGKESFALTIAKVKQEETLVELRRATNLLEKLSAELSQLFKRGEALPTNGLAARQFFVKAVESLPTLPQLQTKRAEIEPAIFQIQSAQGTAYLPDLHLIADAKKTEEWASTTSTAVTGFHDRLEELLRDAQPEPSAPTESPEPAKALVAKADAAAPSKMPAEMKDEAERILAETKTAVAQILEEAQSQANCILAETQKRAETILAALREKEPLEESRIERAPGEPIAETARGAEKKTAMSISESSSPMFLRVSTDPKIRGQLMAFTTPGNMRLPGMFRAEKAPISLSQLRSFGALEPTIAGLERLVEVASTRQDAVRPRWKFKTKQGIWQRKANEVAQARSVQQLFTDLGADFVAAGLLAE